MKKRVVAVAALGCAVIAPVHAQSSVTLYGVIDEGLQFNTNNKNVVGGRNVGGRLWNLDSLAGPSGSRWGIKGSEDLGGGLKAVFTLESGVNINNGNLGQGGTFFGRQAYVGLSSSRFGSVLLGRQYDSVNDYIGFMTFGLASYGSGISHPGDVDNTTHTSRANNTIKYTSPDFSGFTFGGTVSLGGVAGSISQSSGFTGGAGYRNGPTTLGVVYQLFKNPSNAGAILNGNSNAVAPATTTAFASLNSGYLAGTRPATSWQVIGAAGSYNFGSVTVAGAWTNVRYGNIGRYNGATASFNDVEVNGMYQLNPQVFFSLAYNYLKGNAVSGDIGDQTYHQVSAMGDYVLSKRTDVYVTATFQAASGTNSLGAPAVANISQVGDSSNNRQALFRVGLRHRF
ncbi:porin [Paraburkholderia sp. ZP32-5]|uniref:porin n=1 Tax=Paraburkholderia sp. ZP32-5 TaxID=2883245 RepID=UPI001F3F3253|nr:porin [Paraburkholderia sp. ZP32-5]